MRKLGLHSTFELLALVTKALVYSDFKYYQRS